MILNNPLFKRPHCEKYYVLYYETGMSLDYANNCDYKPSFD